MNDKTTADMLADIILITAYVMPGSETAWGYMKNVWRCYRMMRNELQRLRKADA